MATRQDAGSELNYGEFSWMDNSAATPHSSAEDKLVLDDHADAEAQACAALEMMKDPERRLDGFRLFLSSLKRLAKLGYPSEDYPCAHWISQAVKVCEQANLGGQAKGIAWHILNIGIRHEAPFERCRKEAASIVPAALRALLSSEKIEDLNTRCFLQMSVILLLDHCLLSISMADVPHGFHEIFPSLAQTISDILLQYLQEPLLKILEFEIPISELNNYLAGIANLSRKLDASSEKVLMDQECAEFAERLMKHGLLKEAQTFNTKRAKAVETVKTPTGAIKIPPSPRITENMPNRNNPFAMSDKDDATRSNSRESGGDGPARLFDTVRQPHKEFDVVYGEALGNLLNTLGEEDEGFAKEEGPGPHQPSTRVWLGNIAGHVREEALHQVFGTFGEGLNDGAVFPARIGPLGYAFINFHRLEDATDAYQQLNNTAVPSLSGNKLLKMRFKPASEFRGNRGRPSQRLVLQQQARQLAQEQLLRDSLRHNSLPALTRNQSSTLRSNSSLHGSQEARSMSSFSLPGGSYSRPAPAPADQMQQLNQLNQADVWETLLRQQQQGALSQRGPESARHASAPVFERQHTSDSASFLGPQNSTPSATSYSGLPEGQPLVTLANVLNPNHKAYNPEFAHGFNGLGQSQREQMWALDRQNNLQSQQVAALQKHGINTNMLSPADIATISASLGLLPNAVDSKQTENFAHLLDQQGLQQAYNLMATTSGLSSLHNTGNLQNTGLDANLGGLGGQLVPGGLGVGADSFNFLGTSLPDPGLSVSTGSSTYGLSSHECGNLINLNHELNQLNLRSATNRHDSFLNEAGNQYSSAVGGLSTVPLASQNFNALGFNVSSDLGLSQGAARFNPLSSLNVDPWAMN